MNRIVERVSDLMKVRRSQRAGRSVGKYIRRDIRAAEKQGRIARVYRVLTGAEYVLLSIRAARYGVEPGLVLEALVEASIEDFLGDNENKYDVEDSVVVFLQENGNWPGATEF